MRKAPLALLVSACLGCGAIAACGTAPGSGIPGTVTTVRTVTSGVAPAQGKASAGGHAVTVPDLIGMNHQQAQDTLQSLGFYNLAEEDATGQGRHLLLDRNWVVVSQEPRAGTKLDPSARVLLRSKKYTD